MTPAEAVWLRKLRDEGPQDHRPILPYGSRACFEQGLTAWGIGATVVITPAGLAALEAHEKTLPTDHG